ESVADRLVEHRLVADEGLGAAIEEWSVALDIPALEVAHPGDDQDQRQYAEDEELERPIDRLKHRRKTGDDPGDAEPEQISARNHKFEREQYNAGDDPGPWPVAADPGDEVHAALPLLLAGRGRTPAIGPRRAHCRGALAEGFLGDLGDA